MRAAFRALGWVVSELIPGQFVDAMRQRDYQAGALHDQQEAQREALVDFEAANDGLDGGELPDHPGYPAHLVNEFEDEFGPESEHREALELNRRHRIYFPTADEVKEFVDSAVKDCTSRAQCLGCGDCASDSHLCQRNAGAAAPEMAETVGPVASTVKQHSPVDPHLSSSTAQRGDDTSSAGASSPQAPAELPTTTVVPSTVTRVVLVHKDGFTERWAESWDMHVQDEGRTLKLFPRTETAPRYEYTPGFFDFPSTTK